MLGRSATNSHGYSESIAPHQGDGYGKGIGDGHGIGYGERIAARRAHGYGKSVAGQGRREGLSGYRVAVAEAGPGKGPPRALHVDARRRLGRACQLGRNRYRLCIAAGLRQGYGKSIGAAGLRAHREGPIMLMASR